MYLSTYTLSREQTNLTFTDSSFSTTKTGKIHSSDRRDARGDGQDIQPPGCAEEHGWSLGQIRQVLGRWRHTGKQTNTEVFDYEEACGHCGETGHFKPNCPGLPRGTQKGSPDEGKCTFGTSVQPTMNASSIGSATVCLNQPIMATRTSRSSCQMHVAFVTTGVASKARQWTACPDLTLTFPDLSVPATATFSSRL